MAICSRQRLTAIADQLPEYFTYAQMLNILGEGSVNHGTLLKMRYEGLIEKSVPKSRYKPAVWHRRGYR